MTHPDLAGRRVLVVEDELLVSMMIEDVLHDEHCVIVGPYANISDVMPSVRELAVDFALLDVNVKGEKIYPVADILEQRGIPFVLLSGYGQEAVPADHPTWRACSKPFTAAQLTSLLADAIKPKTAAN